MKPKVKVRSFLALAGNSLLEMSSTHADTNTWANSNITTTSFSGS